MLETSIFTTSPLEASAIDTINGIYSYVRSQRVNTPKYVGLLTLIQNFESWYQGLEASTKTGIVVHTVNANDANEARRQRDAINSLMGVHIPDNQIPADMPQTPPPLPASDPTSMIILGATVIGGAIVLWKLFK